MLDESTNTGRRLRAWLRREVIEAKLGMALDSFDLVINLVALGMGVACVPIRALALDRRQRSVRRFE